MRHFLAFLTLPVCIAALAACTLVRPKQLPADEVLRRALFHTALLDSVAIDATLSIKVSDSVRPLRATLVCTGTIFPLRSAWIITLGGTVNAGGKSIEGRASRASPSPSNREEIPDPRRIEALATAMTIDSSSLEKELDGSYAYHLSVRRREARESGTVEGNLVIDALSFQLLKADWTLTHVPSAFGLADVSIGISFHDENRTAYSIPVLTGSVLPFESIFDMILPE